MKPNTVIKIGSQYYRLLYKDSGFQHPEDKGLWRAWKVEWNPGKGFEHHDDDDWMISDDKQVIARETGWDRRRFKNTDWGFENYR